MKTLARIAGWAERQQRRLALLMTAVSAIAVALIVVVLVISSSQRYLLASPIPATEEIAAYLFVVLSFFSVVGGFVEGRHIRVLPLWQRLPLRLQGWCMLFGHLGAVVVLAVIIKQTFDFALSSLAFGTRSYVADVLEWPWMMVIPICLTLLALVLVLRMLVDLKRIALREPPPEVRASELGEPL